MLKRSSRLYRFARQLYRWLSPVADPAQLIRVPGRYARFARSWWRYGALPGAEPLTLADAHPVLGQAVSFTDHDPHYVHQAVWAMRRIVASRADFHVDVSSDHRFATMLTAALPVVFLDYRPVRVSLDRFFRVGGSILALPFADGAIRSLSCLHVIEHIGLGRYGDALDPEGSRRAARELARVLAPGGSLYLSTPIGRERVCFNAHRVHAPETIAGMFPGLRLERFSAVGDDGSLCTDASLSDYSGSDYACGLYEFVK